MSEFDEQRSELAGIRAAVEQKRTEVLLAHEALRRAERALEVSARSRSAGNEDQAALLRKRLETARQRHATAAAALSDLRVAESALLDRFAAFTDPTENLGRLSDRSPILLLPLRLETRFRTSPEGTPQLWIRMYPDACLVDTFEPSLTEQEVENARAFWARFWRASGNEALERAAWRELVAAHGSGRAAWVLRQYSPDNPGDKPDASDAADVHLIITASEALPDAVTTYWESAWRADGDAAALNDAYYRLRDALGEESAREAVERYRPFNIDDEPAPPATRRDARVSVTVLRLPAPESMETRRTSWSSPSRVELLPERFVVVAYPFTGPPVTAVGRSIRTPLIVSPDPNAPPERALGQVDDTLRIPPEIAWMFDFQEAVDVGMAMRLDLTPEQAASGFRRIIVLGVRLGDTDEQGRDHSVRLLGHHLHSRGGLEILPQGTPTNNTDSGGSGYSFREDADASFDIFVRKRPQYGIETDWLLRRDGQWLAEMLALPHELVQSIPHADGSDQSDARAMQIALWPGTLGYMMKTQLAPVFSDDAIEWTRTFFTRCVAGRGPIPALRIGRQPYGILPTADFQRLAPSTRRWTPHQVRLHEILKKVENDWKPLVERLSRIGRADADPHQNLLDVLGLHPTSAEYYALHAESVDHKFHELSFLDFALGLEFLSRFPAPAPLALLRSFGYTGDDVPDLFKKMFRARQTPLTGPLIDDRPLSEVDPIRAYAGGKNYIEWLAAAARSGIRELQEERGFDGGRRPAALLYLLLRHALQLGFHDTAVKLHVDAGLVQDAGPLLRDAPFVHVSEGQVSESRYDVLFRAQRGITGTDSTPVGAYIASNIATVDERLREQIEAVDRLAGLPTAKLERLFAEHIDCCTYRLDAWKTGLLSLHLLSLRSAGAGGSGAPSSGNVAAPGAGAGVGATAGGLYLGAYGWLEPVRPKSATPEPADLPPDLAERVNARETAPLVRDPANGGLIHAPSINHATTAAVLRNGYLANEGRLAVNLTSRRVRLALGILEGMRNGQSLGALLGYRFERHVHDNGPIGVRDLIYALRRAFPLAANRIAGAEEAPAAAHESIAAMNVVDGRKLIEYVEGRSPPNFLYPFDVPALPRRAAEQEAAITAALAHIRDVKDAVADLVLAEGVHQAVLGNFERSAGTLDAFAKGHHPPEPDVIRTPRTGVGLTLRAAIHFSPDPPADPLPGIALTPLARAQPAVNAWLRDRLPPPADVGCPVVYTDRATDAEQTVFVSQSHLGLHPIDLLYHGQADAEQALGGIDERILHWVQRNRAPRHDRPITIQHTAHVPGKFGWFALQALLRSLRSLLGSRPLSPADLMRANDASKEQQARVSLPATRVRGPRDELNDTLIPRLDSLATTLNDASVSIDEAIDAFADTLVRFAAYRLPQSGSGFAYEWRAQAYAALVGKVQARVDRWTRRLARFDERLRLYDGLPVDVADEERFRHSSSAEMIISTAATSPRPESPQEYRDNVLVARRAAFDARRGELQALVDRSHATLSDLLDAVRGVLPLTAFDAADLDLRDDEAEIARFRQRLIDAVAALRSEVVDRVARVDALLAEHDAAAASDERTRLLRQAGETLFGEDFQLVPHITLPEAARDELANAWRHSTSGALTRHLAASRDFPVDDWLHGVARVRDKMHDLENVLLLGDAIGVRGSSALTPLQLPYVEHEPWLALEIPDGHRITSDRLLYTAHFAEPFDTARPICGLLVDEWTEVVPGSREITGIAFHYDRPNAEAPQCWLLALPATRDGAWAWDDLLAAVNDALDSAKLRALEPAHVDATAYGWFLPATMSPYTVPEISISNNLLRNRHIYDDETG